MTADAAAQQAWLRVEMPEPGYADRVVADLTRIAGTPSGRALLERIRASGRRVLIERAAKLDPPNAAVGGSDPQAAGGGDITIAYDPADWPNAADRAARPSDVMLFTLLYRSLPLLQGTAEPSADDEAAGVAGYRRERRDG